MSIEKIYQSLPFEEKKAIQIIKLFLDLYNFGEGTGLFSGEMRYEILTQRTKISAYKSKTLLEFWNNLLNQLNCPISAKKHDEDIFSALFDGIETELDDELLGVKNKVDLKIINLFVDKSKMIVMIARNLHTENKAAKKAVQNEI